MTDLGQFINCNRGLVKKADPDRYICTLFANRDVQEFLFAIYAYIMSLQLYHFGRKKRTLGNTFAMVERNFVSVKT